MACAIAREWRGPGSEVAMETTPASRSGVRAERLPLLVLDESAPAVPTRRTAALLAWGRAARRRIHPFEPDVAHVHLSTPALASVAAFVVWGIPSVWTFHLLPEAGWPLDFATRLPAGWALRLVARTGRAAFVGVSDGDAASLRARFPAAFVQSVLNAPPVGADPTDAVDRSAWGNADHALLFVGRLETQKGLDRLLTSLASPELTTKSFRLLVIGDGSARPALVSQAEALGLGERVVFAGAAPARSAIHAADIVICPSRHEGMPLVPMESILAGTPLIASPIAPHRELLDDLPESLMPTSDSDWPAWLSALLSDPGRLRGLARRQARLRGRFSLARVVAQYDAIYRRLAAAHAPRGAARLAPFDLRQLRRCAAAARRKLPSTKSATP